MQEPLEEYRQRNQIDYVDLYGTIYSILDCIQILRKEGVPVHSRTIQERLHTKHSSAFIYQVIRFESMITMIAENEEVKP